jgi:hypothetical protein
MTTTHALTKLPTTIPNSCFAHILSFVGQPELARTEKRFNRSEMVLAVHQAIANAFKRSIYLCGFVTFHESQNRTPKQFLPLIVSGIKGKIPGLAAPAYDAPLLNPERFEMFAKAADSCLVMNEVLSCHDETSRVFDNLRTSIVQFKHPKERTVQTLAYEISVWSASHREELYSIDRLDLDNLDLGHFPENLSHCDGLRILSLTQNCLSHIPACIEDFDRLEQLDLSRNELTRIDSAIGGCIRLRELFLDQNRLSVLPNTIGQLVRMERFQCSNNQLTALPATLTTLVNLRVLKCSDNKLTELAAAIFSLTSLVTLEANHNLLKAIPREIRQLTSLTSLQLEWNRLESVPQELTECTQLETLSIGHNLVTALPGSMDRLQSLYLLDIEYNQLRDLPASLARCPSLDELYLTNNLFNLTYDQVSSQFPQVGNIYMNEPEDEQMEQVGNFEHGESSEQPAAGPAAKRRRVEEKES